jgi:uroporphyrinogen decarboxylase
MKEVLLDTLQGKRTERTPWVPFVGVHGGYLIGENAQGYLRSDEALYTGIHEAILRYQPDGIPVVFDLQIEAEIMGCKLRWAKDCPPSVISHPLESKPFERLPLPTAHSGRIPLIMKTVDRIKDRHPEVGLLGLITGPLTLAVHLKGTELLTQMILEPEAADQVLSFCEEVAMIMAALYAEKGVEVVAVVDPMISQIAPRTFQRFLSDPYRRLFDHIRSLDCLSASFVCGDARKNLAAICQTNPNSLFVDENVPLAQLRDCAKESGIAFGGNIPLAQVLLSGSPDQCRLSAAKCIYESGGRGHILAPGCDLLYATPEKNLAAIGEMVHSVTFREMGTLIAALSAKLPQEKVITYELPDYQNKGNVTVDIITLNSRSCAACQYMVEAVSSLVEELPVLPIDWQEYSLMEPQTLPMIKTFGVKGIPAIVIDGEVAFESVVPAREELLERIKRASKKHTRFPPAF